MRSAAQWRSQVIAAFRFAPDFSVIDSLHRASRSQQNTLLRWLDQSGLALYFLHRLDQHGAADRLPARLREALEHRQASNRARTADMLSEFRRIAAAFATSDPPIRFCTLKGFSLVPDFCLAPHLRHQTDFDFLVAPESLPQAGRIMESLGYAQTEIRSTGQITLATPLRHIPTAADDIYAAPRHREVDLLPSLQLDFHGVSLHTPSDPLNRSRQSALDCFPFPVLAPEDAFSLQVFHTFSHFLGSWIRLSWLIEIAYFLETRRDNDDLWRSVIQCNTSITTSAPLNDNSRQAFALVLSLTDHLFATPIPRPLADWCATVQIRPIPIAAWVNQFGSRFAQADLNGSKLSLFLHRYFIEGRRAWSSYLLSRLFPFGRNSSIGSVSIAPAGARIRAQVVQWLHSVRRVLFHARELASLPVEFIRWKRALRVWRRQRTLLRPQSNSQHTGVSSAAPLADLARLPD